MFIVFDIGGTKVATFGFHNSEPNSLAAKTLSPSAELKDYRTAIHKLKELAMQMAGTEHIDGVAVSFTGDVNPVTGIVGDSLFFPTWNNQSLCKDLGAALNCKVLIENDAVCAGLSEIIRLDKEGFKNYTFIAVGTGIGGMKLMRLSNSYLIFPWDFGHMIMHKDGRLCPCGQKGCLEMYSSGSGIESAYGKKLEEISDPLVWEELTDNLAHAISIYLAVNTTELFIFGGGIMLKKAGLVETLREKVENMTVLTYAPLPKFEISRYQEDAQAYGALRLLAPQYNLLNINYQ